LNDKRSFLRMELRMLGSSSCQVLAAAAAAHLQCSLKGLNSAWLQTSALQSVS
jgi:hypothetical protein